MEIIELKRLADLPTGRSMFSTTDLKTPEQAQAWAERLGAGLVYTFRQLTGGMIAWVIKGENHV